MRSWTGRQAAATVFYVVLVLLVLGCVLPFLPLPHRAATAISHNSEGYVIALILLVWIQFVRPRLADRRTAMAVTVAAAAVLLAIGVFLIVTDLPSRVRTLNEAFLALAVLVPYVQLRRRWLVRCRSRWRSWRCWSPLSSTATPRSPTSRRCGARWS